MPVVTQRQVSTAFRLPAEAVEEFHKFSTRRWILHFFYGLPESGSHSPRCTCDSGYMHASVYGGFWKNLAVTT